jgi:hypothetical protein
MQPNIHKNSPVFNIEQFLARRQFRFLGTRRKPDEHKQSSGEINFELVAAKTILGRQQKLIRALQDLLTTDGPTWHREETKNQISHTLAVSASVGSRAES